MLKYLLVLALNKGDVVFRLLTSKQYGRPETPACYHGDPYGGYYLGVLGGVLSDKSWVTLGEQKDYDGRDFYTDIRDGELNLVMTLPQQILCSILSCAAQSDDTTTIQTRIMRDLRASLGCP